MEGVGILGGAARAGGGCGRGYADHMPSSLPADAPLLVLDTCGERASIALFSGDGELLGEVQLAERAASAALLGAIRSLLMSHGTTPRGLGGLGVVAGPGSFTGVRVGLAVAKGICEAVGVPLAAVSRLAVLAEAAGLREGYALLGAGRDQVYARRCGGGEQAEWMAPLDGLREILEGKSVATTGSELAASVSALAAEVRVVELSARHAVAAVRRCLADGGSDPGTTDANYVRNEDAIYAKGKPVAGR